MKLNLTKFLLAAVLLLTLCASKKALAAVPTLSYSPATNTYVTGTAISTLTPTSSGVGTTGTYGTPTTFGSTYSTPQGIAIDPSGNVYVTNLGTNKVRKFNSAGTFQSNFGSGLSGPYDISFDASGNGYITNYSTNTITQTTSGNVSSTFISTGLTNPYGTAVDAAGNVYVANYNGGGAGGAILKYNSSGTLIQTITTASPSNVAVDANGNIYALSYGSGTVTRYNSAGVSQGSIGGFSSSFGLTIDASGNIYVADKGNNRIAIYTPAGALINTVTTTAPTGVAVDASGNMYVAGNSTVLKFVPAGGFSINKTLPAGLSFNTSTGAISGTPTATSASTVYTISAYNASGAGTTTETITVNPPLPAFSYATPQTYTQYTAISTLSSVSTGGAITSYSGTLPAGLTLNTSTGDITGTPSTVSAATNYTITGTNAGGSSTATINITVNLAPPAFSYASPQTYTQGTAISTLSPTNTGGAVTTYTTSGLPGGLLLNSSTGAITGTPTTVAGATNCTVTATNSAGSSNAIISIAINPSLPAISYASPQTYTQGVPISPLSPSSTGGTVATYSAASLPAGLTINASTGVISGTPTAVVFFTNYTITATNVTGSSTATVNITVNLGPPIISYPTPQTYVVGTAISTLSPTSTGGTVTTYSGTLPAGLNLNTTTGAITGTPTTVSTATNYTITATNLAGSSTATINITVNPKLPAISYATPQTYTQNVAITSLAVSSTGGPVASYSATLPAGLSINTSTGAITGTPTTPAVATNYTVTATNITGSSTATINITVIVAAPTSAAVTQCGAGAVLTASDVSSAGGTYNWYAKATGGVAFQSSSSNTFSAVSTATYYVSYTYGGIESARTSVVATINPIVSNPFSGAYFSYPFNGNTNDVSSYQNAGNNSGASLTTDRYGASNAAYSFNGSSNYMNDPFLDNNPANYTVSIWFNTTTTTGGSIIGMESGNYDDRVLYMSNSGQVYWGLYPGSVQTINTAASYNDGNWHHAVVTVSATSGSTLYLDGIAQATSATMTVGNGTNGYWQMGYSLISGWANAPSSNYFSGKLDDIAVYHRVLSSAEITASNDLNQIYSSAATACTALSLNAPTITGATYTWKDPNNNTQTGQSVSFPGAVAGNYTLTVTNGPGSCSSTATIVPVVYGSSSAAFNALASVAVNTNTSISLFSPVGSSTYSWNFGGGTSSSGTTGQGPFSVQWSSTGVKTITLTVTTSGGCVITTSQTITVTSTTYGNYTYSRNITMNNAAVGMSGNVTNFPVLLSIQNNDLIVSGTCADKIQNPNGPNYDFAFFDSSTQSELYYQIESYNQTTGTLLVWVRIPIMYAATNNVVSFYYGAKVPSVTHNAAFSALTWTADYQAVYHFSETSFSPTTADGTANGRNASLAGFSAGSYVANGKIGSCYTFGGVQDMEAAATAPTTIITTSAWVNTSNNNSDEKIISDQNSSGEASGGYKLAVYFGSTEIEMANNGNRGSTTPAEPGLANNTWYYVQGVYDGTTLSTYVNGVQYKKQAVTATTTFTNTLYIGIGEGKIYPFSGMIDEPRVSTIAKSSDWIKMEYTNQNNPTAFITVSSTAAAVSTANGGSIPGEISYTWTGGTSTDPSLAANWTNSTGTSVLPPFDGTETLIIPTGLSKYPALTAAISAYGVNIASGAQINLNGYIMSVGCHIYNGAGGQILYGTSSTAGGITFNGSLATQYYYGYSSGIANLANLTVSNTAAGTVDITGGAVGINNTLTITKGNLLVDNAGSGSLTLLSTATNSGSVAAIPTGSTITGNVNVQRWLSSGAGTRGYRLLTSPVNISSLTSGVGNIGLSYLNTNATFNSTTYYGGYTQGPGSGFTVNGSTHPIIYLYDESRATDNSSFTSGKNIGVYGITGASGSPAYSITTLYGTLVTAGIVLPATNSYIYYFVGSNQSTVVASTLRVPDATTLTATGYLNQGDITFKSWKTGGTTMPYDVTAGTTFYGVSQVGNPYASTISLATLYSDNYNSSSNAIGSAFYELIPGGNYVSYNASNGHVSDLRASQYIVSGQGFLAQATATGQSLTFKEDQKVAYNSSATLLESFPSGPGVRVDNLASGSKVRTDAYAKLAPISTNPGINTGFHLQLTKDSADFAQTGIYFSSTGSDKYVATEDATEIDGGTPVVYLSSYSSDNVNLSINTMADYGQGKRIRLYATAAASGTYNINIADITDFDTTNYSVYLVDKLQKDSLDLVHFKTYAFTINLADTTTFGSNRFVLAIDHKAVGQYLLTTFNGQKVATGVQLNWKAENAGNYTGYTLQKLNSSGGYDSLYSVQSDTSISAYNYIDTHPIIGNNTYRLAQNGITGAITYSAAVTIGYNSTTPNGALTLYPNPATTIINVNLASSSINVPTYIANIYNSSGVRVAQQTVTGNSWTSDVSSYKLGIYVLQVKDTNGYVIGTAKFVKVQ